MTVQGIVEVAIASGDEIGVHMAAHVDGELAIDTAPKTICRARASASKRAG